LLADCDLATSESAAIDALIAMSDERFDRFRNTGKLDDQRVMHPNLVEICETILRRNLETAKQRREENTIAEGNRQQPEPPPTAHASTAENHANDFGAATSDGFVSLFNGRDLTGWKMHGTQPGKWRVENGVLRGSDAGWTGRVSVTPESNQGVPPGLFSIQSEKTSQTFTCASRRRLTMVATAVSFFAVASVQAAFRIRCPL
jgi:hypothetical protein